MKISAVQHRVVGYGICIGAFFLVLLLCVPHCVLFIKYICITLFACPFFRTHTHTSQVFCLSLACAVCSQFTLFMHRIFGQHFQLSIVLLLLLRSISHFSLPYSSRIPPLLQPVSHFIAAFCSFAADSELLCRDNLERVWKQMQQLFRIL